MDRRYLLILMDAHQIEPVLLLGARLEEFYLPIPESPKKTFVSYVTHAIECQFGVSFL